MKNFFIKENARRIIKQVLVLNIIVCICISIVLPKTVMAAQLKYQYTSGKLSQYPGYDTLLQGLQQRHPNWSFTILETGLDWNDVIKNETVASHGRNLIYYTYSGNWVCSTCGNATYDSGKWKCASETAVAYYMDPRNWLNDDNIFQFEDLSYNGSIQNISGVEKILSTVPWARGEKITYISTEGNTATLDKSYAQVVMEAAKEAGISPYHLAARIKQEQGARETASSTGRGDNSTYTGYYNFLNIQATGGDIIGNALRYAKTQGWDNPEKAIKGGAKFLSASYISRGQSNLYLQKFDVDNSDGSLYYHQYMQNVSAALTEGNTVKSSYSSMGLMDSNINFVIPVYENMPNESPISPAGLSVVTENVKVTGDDVIVRSGRGRIFPEIARVNTGDILLRIETAGGTENDYYWDKVVLSDGRKGYIARNYLTKIDDVTNVNASAVANVNVNLRNGPGTSETKVITTITSGQAVTIIESGKYNGLDGYDWSRVKLSSGKQGYLVSKYLTELDKTNYVIAYVNCSEDGRVYVRDNAGINSSVITALAKDTKVTILQKNAGDANGYSWDKIVTTEGIEGYMANSYLSYEDDTKDNNKSNPTEGGTTDKGNTPNEGETPTKNGNEEPDVKVEIKKGDANADGTIDSADLLTIQKHLLNVRKITDSNKLLSADANSDGVIDSADLLKIQKYLLGVGTL